MNPVMLALLAFLAVAGLVGAVAFFMRDTDNTRAARRLDTLIGRGGRKDSSADLLLKQALQEVDKKTLLDVITPEVFNLRRVFEQADANIRPSALFGVALVLAVIGGAISWMAVGSIYVSPIGGLVFFSLPFVWLFWRR